MQKTSRTIMMMCVIVGIGTQSLFADQIWEEYKAFLENKKDFSRSYFKRTWEEKFEGKNMSGKGYFKEFGDALFGGTYVHVEVDGRMVKLLIEKTEEDKALGTCIGDQIEYSGFIKSRGDLTSCITLKRARITPLSTGSSWTPKKVTTEEGEALWQLYEDYYLTPSLTEKQKNAQWKQFVGKTISLSAAFLNYGSTRDNHTYVLARIGSRKIELVVSDQGTSTAPLLQKGNTFSFTGLFQSPGGTGACVTFKECELRSTLDLTASSDTGSPISKTQETSTADKLRELKKLLDEELLTQEEYDAKRQELLSTL